MPVGIDPSARQRRHYRTHEVHDEEPADGRRAQVVWRRGNVERHVGEHGDLREENAEADAARGNQATIAEQVGKRTRPVRAADPSCGRLAWQPQPQRRRDGAVQEAQRHERSRPADVGRHEPGDRASGEPAEDRAAHVRRGGPTRVRGRPDLVDVGHRAGEDAGRGDPLHEPPEDQLLQAVRRRGKHSGHGERARRADDDAPETEAVRQPADERRRDRDRDRRRGDGEADMKRRRLEGPREKRQQGLRHVQVEKGGESRQNHRNRRQASHWSILLP